MAKTFTDLANRVCKLNDFVLALDIIGYAELLDVLDPAIFCTKAEIYRSQQYLDEALEQYDRTVEAFPQSAVARNGRAETLREMGRLEEALEQYDRTIEAFPHNEYARNGRAETLR